jgi:hypothetical protein
VRWADSQAIRTLDIDGIDISNRLHYGRYSQSYYEQLGFMRQRGGWYRRGADPYAVLSR